MPTTIWAVDGHDHEHTMTLTATVKLDGKLVSSGSLVAFAADGEVRGIGGAKQVPFGPHAGESVFMMMVYGSHASEAITFRHTPDEAPLKRAMVTLAVSSGSTKLVSAEAAMFEADETLGDATNPFSLTGALLGTSDQEMPWPRARKAPVVQACPGQRHGMLLESCSVQGRQ